MDEYISTLKRSANTGNEGAQILLSSAYLYSVLHNKIPESADLQLFIKHKKGFINESNAWTYRFPNPEYGYALTATVVQRYVSDMMSLMGQGISPVGIHTHSASPALSGKSITYPVAHQYLDCYYLLWDFGYLHYLRKDYCNAGYYLTQALRIEEELCEILCVKASRDVSRRDLCILTDQEISKAQYIAGKAFETGDSKPVSYDTAAFYFAFSIVTSKTKNVAALTSLGIMFHEGRGVPKDDIKARAFLTPASKENKLAAEYLQQHLTETHVPQQVTNNIIINVIDSILNHSPFEISPSGQACSSMETYHSEVTVNSGTILNRSPVQVGKSEVIRSK